MAANASRHRLVNEQRLTARREALAAVRRGTCCRHIGKQRRPQMDGEVNIMHAYRCHPKHCTVCPIRDTCTPNPKRGRAVKRSEHEDLISAHQAYMQTPEALALYKLRRQTVELGFADIKEHRHLQRFSGRGLARALRQLAATVLAHNLMVLDASPTNTARREAG